ncbi:MAG: response regulator [Candidatus Binatia bacterium]
MPCNILVVEDEAVARRNITIFLQRASHNVHQAETGEAAVDLISRIDFNTVISDFRLSGTINGIDILRHQRKRFPGKRLILITAFGSAQVQSEAEALGAIYMEKPLSLSNLLSSIEPRP